MSDLLEKIKGTGYWKVVLRPVGFDSLLIQSLSECKTILQNSIVNLRGWDYPHIESHLITSGQDYIEHETDYTNHPGFGYVEFMRLYQSGQFYHLFAFREDYNINPDDIPKLSMRTLSPTNRYMSILSTVYTLTEIYIFASKLFNQIGSSGIKIKMQLNGMEGRQLFFYNPSRYLRRDYRCTIPRIDFEKTIQMEELIATPDKLALNSVTFFFERFDWDMTSPMMFSEEQKKFLERRL